MLCFNGFQQFNLQILKPPNSWAQVMTGFLPSLWASGLRHVSIAWVSIFLLSRIPQAAANVAAESWACCHTSLSWPLRATLYTQLMALPCNFLAAFTLSLFWKGDTGMVLEDYVGGFACLTDGRDGVCAGAWRSVLLFAIPGMLYTLTEFQVLQAAPWSLGGGDVPPLMGVMLGETCEFWDVWFGIRWMENCISPGIIG